MHEVQMPACVIHVLLSLELLLHCNELGHQKSISIQAGFHLFNISPTVPPSLPLPLLSLLQSHLGYICT